MSVTLDDLKEILDQAKTAIDENISRKSQQEKDRFNERMALLWERLKAMDAANAADPAAGLTAAALPNLEDLKRECDALLVDINRPAPPTPSPHETRIDGPTSTSNTDISYDITATTGDTLSIKYTKGKPSISIPSTDGMPLVQKVQLARNMVYFALKEGAYKTDADGNITFTIRSNDFQLRTALEETVKSLGYKFKTPDYSDSARQAAKNEAAENTGLLAAFSGALYPDPVSRNVSKIAGMVESLSLQDSNSYREKKRLLKENQKLAEAIAPVTQINLKQRKLRREKTSDEILQSLDSSKSLHKKVYSELTKFTTANSGASEEQKAEHLVNYINQLKQKNEMRLALIDRELADPKQKGIIVREQFLQEFEQGANVYPTEADRDKAIDRFKKRTIEGQVFRRHLNTQRAEAIFARKFKNPKDAAGKLGAMATDGVGSANRYEKIAPADVKIATENPNAMARQLTATGKTRHEAALNARRVAAAAGSSPPSASTEGARPGPA